MFKRKIAFFLILIGASLIIYGISSHISYKKQERELINLIEDNFINSEAELKLDENIKVEENLNSNPTSKEDNYVNNKINPIGILEIPSIKLKAGIIKGATTKELRQGIGYYTNTSLPSEIEGNFVIAAHDSGKMPIFRNLKSLEIGDEVIVNQKNKSFKYIVTDKFIVNPYDVEILQSVQGKKQITMFTCTNKGKQRLVVRGEAIE